MTYPHALRQMILPMLVPAATLFCSWTATAQTASPDPAPPDESSINSAPAPSPSMDAVRALEEATAERRVFRHISIGALEYPGARYTWVLHRRGARARLDIFCQSAVATSSDSLGIRANGDENDEAKWGPPIVLHYVGTRSGDLYQLSGEVAPVRVLSPHRPMPGAPPPGGGCERAPLNLTMRCRSEKVAVRPAGPDIVSR